MSARTYLRVREMGAGEPERATSPPAADFPATPESGAAERLLDTMDAMLRELRPTAPPRAVTMDSSIERDLGIDSLSRVELGARIERAFGVSLPDEAALSARTPRELLDAIAATAKAPKIARGALESAPLSEAVAAIPEHASTLIEVLDWHAQRHSEREHVRLFDGERTISTLSYAQLRERAHALAGALAKKGLQPGDTVALMLPTGSAFLETFFGILLTGGIPVPLYPPSRWTEIEAHVRGRAGILQNADARVLVTVPEAMFVARLVRAELPHIGGVVSVDDLRDGAQAKFPGYAASDDPALLQYTSGSTGQPKGVVLSHQNLLSNIRAMGRAASIGSQDRFVSWLPLYHDMGLIGAWLGCLYYAVPLVLMAPTTFLARPSRWLTAIHRFRATLSAAPNFAYEIAAAKIPDAELADVDLASWRIAFNGAEPVRAATLERFAARFERHGFDRRALTPVYGLAESAVGLSFPPLGRGPLVERIDTRRLAQECMALPARDATVATQDVVSCGVPLPEHEIRIVDDAGREAPARHEGRIEFRGPSATKGYYGNPEATRRLFHDGWLDTGDVGYIAGGELFVTSRSKDLIKRGGHNIHPYDLEGAVGEIPGIRKGCVAVFGTLDHATGSERVIVVAETNDADPMSHSLLRRRIMALAPIHLNGPADEVLLVPPRTVLKTSSGKIRRSACRELYEKGLLGARRRSVWLQIAGLLGTAVAVTLRRALRAGAHTAYGLYGLFVFAVTALSAVTLFAIIPVADVRMRAARICARLLLRMCGIALRVEGEQHVPHAEPAVIVANHSSYIDAIVLTAVLAPPVRHVAKHEFVRMPILGFAMRRLGTCFVARADAAQGIEDTAEVAHAVRSGYPVVFFPEGTFSRRPGLGAFRLGAFAVAASTHAPVVPVVLRGTRSVLREGQWLPSRGAIDVIVSPPERSDGPDWSAALRLRDHVRAGMLIRCEEPDLAR